MSFYEEISKYYDAIFPTGREQVDFIRKAAGSPPKTLLDIACGTGGYSIALAEQGYTVTATDIDAAMMEGLEKKLQGTVKGITCMKAGMLELADRLKPEFDLAFCIGNSIVHLNDRSEIAAFLKSAKGLLKKDGQLIIQIINFDRVLHQNVKQLPPIKNSEAGVVFERYYRYDDALGRIFFRTVLTAGGQTIENEIPLFPLLSRDLDHMLKEAGFQEIQLFGDFSGNAYDENGSFMLVVRAC